MSPWSSRNANSLLMLLQEVDSVIKQLHEERHLPVLSFGEGAPLSVLMGLPPLVVVPDSSAHPGYGDFVLLEGVDHINACKPVSKDDPSYRATADFLQKLAGKGSRVSPSVPLTE